MGDGDASSGKKEDGDQVSARGVYGAPSGGVRRRRDGEVERDGSETVFVDEQNVQRRGEEVEEGRVRGGKEVQSEGVDFVV